MTTRSLCRYVRREVAASAVAVVVAAGAVDASTPAEPTGSGAAAEPPTPFHAVPDPLPDGAPGTLIRNEPATDIVVPGAAVHRIMYLSESLAGQPIAVTGLLAVPTSTPAPADGWGLVTHAHGSTGTADVCASSVDPAMAVEFVLVASMGVERGLAVVSTDYEGLGTPGPHPSLVGESAGRAVLDAARAARQLPGVRFSPDTTIAGYSMGGQGALFAAQLAADWAPDLSITGTVAGAPGTVVTPVRNGYQSTRADPPDAAIAAVIIAGIVAAHPDVDPSDILTEAGLDYIATLEDSCRGDVPDAATPLFLTDPTTVEPWASLLADSEPGQVAASSPILVISSAEDVWVPIEPTTALVARQCAAGQVVEQRVLPAGDHVTAAIPAYEQGLDWLVALGEGAAPVSTCNDASPSHTQQPQDTTA